MAFFIPFLHSCIQPAPELKRSMEKFLLRKASSIGAPRVVLFRNLLALGSGLLLLVQRGKLVRRDLLSA